MAFEGGSDLYGEIHGLSIGVEKLNVCFPSASHLRSRDAVVWKDWAWVQERHLCGDWPPHWALIFQNSAVSSAWILLIPAGWSNSEVVFNMMLGLPCASYVDFLNLNNGRKLERRARVPVSHLSLLARSNSSSSQSISICHPSQWVHGLFIIWSKLGWEPTSA